MPGSVREMRAWSHSYTSRSASSRWGENLLRKWSRSDHGRLQRHSVTKPLYAVYRTFDGSALVTLVEVVASEFTIDRSPHQQVVDDDENGMGKGNDCTVAPSASSQAMILSG